MLLAATVVGEDWSWSLAVPRSLLGLLLCEAWVIVRCREHYETILTWSVAVGGLVSPVSQCRDSRSEELKATNAYVCTCMCGAGHRTQGSHMLGKCFPTESHSSLSPVSYSIRQERHTQTH